jgi:hypothetical protein
LLPIRGTATWSGPLSLSSRGPPSTSTISKRISLRWDWRARRKPSCADSTSGIDLGGHQIVSVRSLVSSTQLRLVQARDPETARKHRDNGKLDCANHQNRPRGARPDGEQSRLWLKTLARYSGFASNLCRVQDRHEITLRNAAQGCDMPSAARSVCRRSQPVSAPPSVSVRSRPGTATGGNRGRSTGTAAWLGWISQFDWTAP